MKRNKWTDKEIEYLKTTYPEKESLGCIELHEKYTLKSITAKAKRLGLKSRRFNKWSKEEDSLLEYSWQYDSMEELLAKFPNRTYHSLMLRANKVLKVKSKRNRLRKGSFDFLDNITKESSYWWGFIIADGHLSLKNGLQISLNIKDLSHLQKLQKHLGGNITFRKTINAFNNSISEMCLYTLGDINFAKKWLKILEINSPKTYTPPNLNTFLNKENLLSFFIGMTDGDGCIWESKNWLNLKIELHINWLDTLQIISNNLKELYDIDSKVKITKKGTSKLDINTKKDLKILKDYINNVEFMERKWSKLDSLT